MSRSRSVVVVGAGMSAFATAAALARHGVDVAVWGGGRIPHDAYNTPHDTDQTPRGAGAAAPPAGGAPRGFDYFGYTLWPAATSTLDWLGVGEQVQSAGCRLESMRWYDGAAAELLSLPLGALGQAGRFTGIRPSALHELLERAARDAGVETIGGVRGPRLLRQDRSVLVREAAVKPPEVGARPSREAVVEPSRAGVKSPREAAVEPTRVGAKRSREAAVEPIEVRARLVLVCDGSESPLRAALGLRALRWRPPRQLILTGVGGRSPERAFHQGMGAGRASGCVSLGPGGSWLYSVLHAPPGGDPLEALRAQARRDAWAGQAPDALERVAIFRPWSVRVPRWARDRVLLVGDAAHAMLPHVGLGGSTALEGIPALTELVIEALAADDLSAERLEQFRRRRAGRVAHAQRVSETWALATTAAVPGLERLRDAGLRRVAARSAPFRDFLEAFAAGQRPALVTRLRLCLP